MQNIRDIVCTLFKRSANDALVWVQNIPKTEIVNADRQIINGVIGAPKASKHFTPDQLQRMGLVGLYGFKGYPFRYRSCLELGLKAPQP